MPSLAFFTFALFSVEERKAYPLLVEQIVPSKKEQAVAQKQPMKAAKQGKGATKSGKAGRAKGSKNKDKRMIEWTPELRRIERMSTPPCSSVSSHSVPSAI